MAILLSKNSWNILFYRSMTSSFFYAFSSEQLSVWHFLPFSTQWHVTQNTFLEYSGKLFWALCSRNFQNVKLRLDFVKIWWFYCPSDFTGNQILANSNSPKLSFLAFLEALNLVNLGLESCMHTVTKNQNSEPLKLAEITYWNRLNSPKFDFT